MKKYGDEMLDATIKDLKIYEIDDGREFLEKYLRADEDATFTKVPRKQERAEVKAATQDRRAGKEKEKAAERRKVLLQKNGLVFDEDDDSEGDQWKSGKAFDDWLNAEIFNQTGIYRTNIKTERKPSKSEEPKYLDKVETSTGGTRYIYDEDELKALKKGGSK
jgi:hypothetical protein